MKVKTKIVKELYAEASDLRKRITSEAADEIQKRFKTDAETRVAVDQALTKVLHFIEGGGQLDINMDKPDEATKEGEGQPEGTGSPTDVRKLIERIRKDIKLLPGTTRSDDEDEANPDKTGG